MVPVAIATGREAGTVTVIRFRELSTTVKVGIPVVNIKGKVKAYPKKVKHDIIAVNLSESW